MGTEVYK